MSLISIIVGVYNSQDFLDSCLKSIQNQSYSNIEVIVINDGSTDRSTVICDLFAKKDKRFKIIHQQNKGIGFVRNLGLTLAKGDFILFIDSDDFIDKSMVEILYKEITDFNHDIVVCDFYRLKVDCKIDYQNIPNNPHKIICGILEGLYFGALWNKMIRKSFIIKHKLNVDVSLIMYEDVLFLIQLLLNNPKIGYANIPLYYYRISENSISHSRKKETFESAFHLIETLEKLFLKNNHLKKSLDYFKVSVRKDILLFGKKIKINDRYQETNSILYKTNAVTNFQKIVFFFNNIGLKCFGNFLLYTRSNLRK